ncbi:MAG: hypothetical protein FWG47_00445 [Propionibacteriaceae bacterium]|nr:hypothetical protein [Propionibacteriaceae bacterium]
MVPPIPALNEIPHRGVPVMEPEVQLPVLLGALGVPSGEIRPARQLRGGRPSFDPAPNPAVATGKMVGAPAVRSDVRIINHAAEMPAVAALALVVATQGNLVVPMNQLGAILAHLVVMTKPENVDKIQILRRARAAGTSNPQLGLKTQISHDAHPAAMSSPGSAGKVRTLRRVHLGVMASPPSGDKPRTLPRVRAEVTTKPANVDKVRTLRRVRAAGMSNLVAEPETQISPHAPAVTPHQVGITLLVHAPSVARLLAATNARKMGRGQTLIAADDATIYVRLPSRNQSRNSSIRGWNPNQMSPQPHKI